MDFKVSYLDAGLTNTYFSDSDQLFSSSSSTQYSSTPTSTSQQSQSQTATKSPTPQRVNRRYKTQLRDFLSTCRTKRKINSHHHQPVPIAHPTPTTPAAVDYIPGTDPAAAAAVAVAYSNLNTMYPTTYSTPTATADNGLSGYIGHTSNFHHHHHHHQSLYDNRLPYLTTTDNLFHQYRPLTNYYPDYHSTAATTPYVSNGFLDISSRGSPSSLPTYDTGAPSHHHMAAETKLNDCDKMYSCNQPLMEQKYTDPSRYIGGGNPAATVNSANKCVDLPQVYMPTSVAASTSCDVQANRNTLSNLSSRSMKPVMDHGAPDHSPVTSAVNGILTPKMEDQKTEVMQQHYSPLPAEPPRQTVLMWALNHTPQSSSSGRSPTTTETGSNASTPPVLINGANSVSHHYLTATPPMRDSKKSPSVASYGSSDPLKSLAEMNSMSAGVTKWKPETPPSPKAYYHHHHQYGSDGGTTEVWPPPHHQFYPYHHHHQ